MTDRTKVTPKKININVAAMTNRMVATATEGSDRLMQGTVDRRPFRPPLPVDAVQAISEAGGLTAPVEVFEASQRLTTATMGEVEIPLAKLRVHKNNPRPITADDEDLENTIRSMADPEIGLAYAIKVQRATDGFDGFDVLEGQRRFIAAYRLGWKTIRAQVRDIPLKGLDAFAFGMSVHDASAPPKDIDLAVSLARLYEEGISPAEIMASSPGLTLAKQSKLIKITNCPGSHALIKTISGRPERFGPRNLYTLAQIAEYDEGVALELAREIATASGGSDEIEGSRSAVLSVRHLESRLDQLKAEKAMNGAVVPERSPKGHSQRHDIEAAGKPLGLLKMHADGRFDFKPSIVLTAAERKSVAEKIAEVLESVVTAREQTAA